VGRLKLPSWVPWKPNVVLWPGDRLPFQPQQLLNVGSMVLPPLTITFQLLVTLAGSLKCNGIVQPLIALEPLLVTVTSNWYPLLQTLVGLTVQPILPPPELLLELELLDDELELDELLELELLDEDELLLDDELELLLELDELLELDDELELLDELLLELLEDELELLLELDELLLDEEELELEEVLPGGTMTVQVGSLKLPSWLPCMPKVVL
jgi:hypothetical protein